MAKIVRITRQDGYVNFLKGKRLAFSTWFWDASPFTEGISAVEKRDCRGDITCQFIRDNGRYLTRKSFYCAWPFHNGFAIVQREADKKYNFINRRGKIIFKDWYKDLWDFEVFAGEMYAVVQRDDDLINFISPDETVASEEWFLTVYRIDENGVAEIQLKNNENATFDFNDFSINKT